MTCQGEESGKLVPSEAEFFIQSIRVAEISANVGAGEWHAKHLRS
jgi:hypothetical protein